LAILLKLPRGFEQIPLFSKNDPRQFERRRFAVVSVQQGFGVEGIHMRRSAFHEKEDYPFGFGGKMRGFGGQRAERRGRSYLRPGGLL
jgi:hypothetical protein